MQLGHSWLALRGVAEFFETTIGACRSIPVRPEHGYSIISRIANSLAILTFYPLQKYAFSTAFRVRRWGRVLSQSTAAHLCRIVRPTN
jgi:hypothetical protein